MSFRIIISFLTLLLLGFVLFEARHPIEQALALLPQVNIWILALTVPLTLLSYLAVGEMIFSYLRQKKLITHIKTITLVRISMELNFVNHVLPSGGASGIAFVNWRMGKLGVKTARATMAQAIRFVANFMAAIAMLLVGLLIVTIDGTVNRWIILMSTGVILAMLLATFAIYFVVSDRTRIGNIASWVTRNGNAIMRRLTFGRKSSILNYNQVKKYFEELHEDYIELKHNKKLLKQPFWWGVVFVTVDVAVFWVTFWALGTYVNPATIMVAYHLASLSAFLVVTPGGVGAYEWIMVTVIAMSGVAKSEAIAGILLARTIILLIIVVVGYSFYQQAIIKYGKPKKSITSTDG